MKKTIFIFAVLIIALLSLFQLSKYSIVSSDLKIEMIIAVIAVVFFVLGIYLNKKSLQKPLIAKGEINKDQLEKIGLSKREYEVLTEICNGHSNREIAAKLFVTESTVKTHVSNILLKLDVKRRTQAIQKAKTLQIVLE